MSIAGDLAPVTDLADDLAGELLEDLLGGASLKLKKIGLKQAERVTGGDRRLSRFGGKTKGRARMNIGYDVTGSVSVVKMRPAGMWVLTNSGARPHPIGAGRRARTGRYTRRRARQVAKFQQAVVPGGRRTATRIRALPLMHPGSAGRGSLVAIQAVTDDVVADHFDERLAELLD